jgi:quinone-modifying oxidoreductase subunit QmoC
MATTLSVQPDSQFIEDVMQGGGSDVKKCYQCATCVSVCSLATEGRPFPRKQVVAAQWGLPERLMGDPAVWLCHDCGDCNTHCPRGARPGDVMGAIRSAVIARLAFPQWIGSIVSNPFSGLALYVLSAMVLLTIAVLPLPESTSSLPVFAAMFPKARLEELFFLVSALVLAALAVGGVRFVRALRANGVGGPILPALGPTLVEIVTHRRFAQCSAHRSRRWGHLFVLTGFSGLAVMGTVVGVGSLVGVMDTPLPGMSPLKIFANLCALLALAGVSLLLLNHLKDQPSRATTTFFDWFFLLTLAGAVATGIASEVLRLAQYQNWMFVIYFIHLTLILTLFVSTPYSKFAHFLYRTMAMAATWPGNQRAIEVLSSSDREPAGGNVVDAKSSPESPGLNRPSLS